jgi:uncharacterized protein (TIGR03086 family)
MQSSDVPLPTFLIIGAQKSGTRWLRANLGKHRDIYTAPQETQFFHSPKRFENSGLQWYRAQFPEWAGERHVGEATPGYMMWRHRPDRVAERIKDTVPDARLIAVLRNPVDRAQSAMLHFVRQGELSPDAGLLDLVQEVPPERDTRCLVSGGWYAASLKPYRELFGDQLLVLLHDDVRTDPQRVYHRALMHIGAPMDYVPPDLGEVVFSNRSNAGQSTEASNGQPALSDDERQRLYAYFRQDVDALRKMIGRDLSRWDPGGSYSVPLGVDLWEDPSRRRSRSVEVTERYAQTASWLEGLVRGVSRDHLELPTPCPKWNVRDLLNQIIWWPRLGAVVLRERGGSEVDVGDFGEDDAATAYRAGADELLATLGAPGSLGGNVTSPLGEMASGTWVQFVLVNQLTHGWDLATATGQDARIPPKLLAHADRLVRDLFFARGAFSGLPRTPELFDVEVPVSESATPTERYVAFLGRDPGNVAVSAAEG